ncbi:hypothetical protein GGP41_004856 [Bipolaris sorokiniana]|uniref:Uncharacterized protein n=1 Tax=Cochliobolus sativus TaxID=45130 RepID=A0A8H5ZFA4_COCSA|nr:hypothetical protein GGP41_004856 [Bipolaris sorokiniana]
MFRRYPVQRIVCAYKSSRTAHTASATDVLDNIDDLAKAGCCPARLCKSCKAEVGAAPVFEYDEEFNDKRYGLDFQVYAHVLASGLV